MKSTTYNHETDERTRRNFNLGVPRLIYIVLFVVNFFASLATAPFAQEQEPESSYKPSRGQRGKDVMWLPTAPSLVDRMLDVARVRPGDFVIDLGSGDGRMVIAAAKRGARARGIEYNPDLVELAKHNAKTAGVDQQTEFVHGDIFESDFSQATVITMFLLTELNLKLRPKILELRPGTRIVSNTFPMGAWIADQIVVADHNCLHSVAYLWIVPAQIAGRWQSNRGELEIKQSFQMISGSIKTDKGLAAITDDRLEGARLTFHAGDAQYLAYVPGNRIEGIAHGPSASIDWSATAITWR